MTSLPLTDFLEALRARNFGIGLHEHMAAGKLLQHWEETDRDQLRNALAALIARHDDDVREIRRAFDEFFPREAARGRETGHTGTFRLVRVTRSRYLWAAAAASLALILWALLSVRALTLAPLPPVARPLLLSVPDAVRAPVTSFGLAFSSFVESLGEPPAVGVPEPPAYRDWRGLGWLTVATLALATVALWGVRLRVAARRWTAASWQAVLAGLPGPFHGDLVLRDLRSRLPRADIEDAAAVLGRSFSRYQRGDALDVTRSLRDTIRSGMLPRLIFRPRRVHETVLVLADTAQTMSVHRRRVHSFLADLRRQGIALDLWWFEGDVSRASRRPYGVPIALDALFRARDDGPLLIVSTGHGAAAMLEVEDRTWRDALRSRSRRVWITPIQDPALWPAALPRVPIVAVPMTRSGLLQAARILTGDDRVGTRSIGRAIHAPALVTSADVDRLQRLASLVPYPTVELLELLRQQFAPDIPESAVLYAVNSHTASADIPFRMTDAEIRTRLREMRAEAPALEIQAREYLLKVLADSEPVRGSAAYLRWQASAAMHRVQLAELRGSDAREAVAELRSLYRGPLWEEILALVARQPSTPRQLGAAVQTRRGSEPPSFTGSTEGVRAFRWVAPGWRAMRTAAVLAIVAAMAALVTGRFRVQASHEPNAFLLEYVADESGGPGHLLAHPRAADAPARIRPRMYRGATPTDDVFTLAQGTPVRLPVDPEGAHIYQIRAELPTGGLALSNTVWAPSVLVVIDAHPWARVTLSSPAAGVSPFQQLTPVTIRLPEGDYELRLENDGLTPELVQRIQVSRTGPREFSFDMPGLDEILKRLGVAGAPAAR